MLTPMDIQNRQLKQQMGGYDVNETNNFLNEVIVNYDELYKENQALKEKITSLSEGIQYYKKMEGSLQNAQTAAEIDALRTEAQAQAEVTRAKANRELEETRNHVRKLIQSYENYRLQFKKLAETQIDMVESESFSIFVPELDELMNGTPSADSVMDDPGIIPINIGSPAPFVDLPDENESASEKSASSASVVEELPVSIAIPVSSTEPFTAPPADDAETAPSIDLNVTSSVLGSTEDNNSSLEVDLGTGSAINIPISAGAFVSPDDDIPEENAFIDASASAGAPMAPTAESPFMDIPGAPAEATTPSMDGTVPSMGLLGTPMDAITPSMDTPLTPTGEIPGVGATAGSVDAIVPSVGMPMAPSGEIPGVGAAAAPADAIVPSMGMPMAPSGEIPGVGTVDAIVPSMDTPLTPSTGTPMDGMLPSMDPATANAQAAAGAASPFVDVSATDPAAAANSYQSPFVDPAAAPAADNNAFMDVPVSQNPVPDNNAFMDVPVSQNPVPDNNAFMDVPVSQNPMPDNNAFMDVPISQNTAPAQADPAAAMNNNAFMDMQAANPAMQMDPMPTTDPAANAMNNAFVDMPMQSSPENNPANMGMGMQPDPMAANPMTANPLQANPTMQPDPMQAANPAMQMDPAAAMNNNAFMDTPPQMPAGANPANMGMGMQPDPMAANPLQANPAMQPDPMQAANPAMQMDPAAAMNNNAFMDASAQMPAGANPANMGMQQNPMTDNPFMDMQMETPAADASMMNPAQAAGGMLATEPQPAAPADNNNMMADPFMDVGSMFDTPINDVPAAEEPAPAQNTQSVESLLDINPFNFIDPE